VIRGAVQGVGFRPFIYRLAKEMRLKGWVINNSQGVFIEAEAEQTLLQQFLQHARSSARSSDGLVGRSLCGLLPLSPPPR
jgi:hydrogenase maturation factor HypF (carbamoyltransferase family)